jgi:5'-deoxynucleotidase YfbR-like HD superfamily hydrolase
MSQAPTCIHGGAERGIFCKICHQERRGAFIRTFTGVHFYPMDPRAEEIVIEDIAHALSMQCRFGGHSFFFYSVAQHSLRASNIVPPADALAALLHDAAEAYLVDVPSPVKAELCEYRAIENRLLEVIAAKFGFQWPLPPTVHAADAELLVAEMRDLFVKSPNWKTPISLLEEVYPLNHGPAKMRFLERFEELTKGPGSKAQGPREENSL